MEASRFFKGRDSRTSLEEFIAFDPEARVDVKSIGRGLK